MKEHIKIACPLDCFDGCSLIASVVDGRVVSIRGDRNHPLTKGVCCNKGMDIAKRQYHPERIVSPRKKTHGRWEDISWDDALYEITEKLTAIKNQYGSPAVMHFSYSGYGGLIKSVDEMFFNYFGGVTVPHGSLCRRAGLSAQNYDFGMAKWHDPSDIIHSKTIIIWGKNPAFTSIHLVQYIKQAKKNGAQVVLIDPLTTATAKLADVHISLKPGTDGALALGMASEIMKNNMTDSHYIKKHVLGFQRFKHYAKDFNTDRVENITGITKDNIQWLAKTYSQNSPSCIILGYGLQRYRNGGNTIRAIDALAAVTGNIGKSGAGVNYGNRTLSRYVSGELAKSYPYAANRRTFIVSKLGEFLETVNNPPVKCIFVTRANPLVQVPNINRTLKAFQTIDFKIVIDMFMTDTAKYADLVLPCTSILEEEDIIFNTMFSPYINFSNKVLEAPEGVLSEYELFSKLADCLELRNYPRIGAKEYLKRAIEPLSEAFHVSYNDLKDTSFSIPENKIPWKDGHFFTPSGKYELFSETALKDGQSPIPVFIDPEGQSNEFTLRLLTPHWKDSLHSQHFAFTDERPKVHISEITMKNNHLKNGEPAKVSSKQGNLIVTVECDNNIEDNIIMIYQGWWHKSGSVNVLTDDCLSDMGEMAAYNECFCKIEAC